jgi:hypothetical protein
MKNRILKKNREERERTKLVHGFTAAEGEERREAEFERSLKNSSENRARCFQA